MPAIGSARKPRPKRSSLTVTNPLKILNPFSELPLEPHLARVLLAAADLDCLDEAITVAAMLSCEGVFTQRSVGDREGSLLDGDGLGDHVMLMQVRKTPALRLYSVSDVLALLHRGRVVVVDTKIVRGWKAIAWRGITRKRFA